MNLDSITPDSINDILSSLSPEDMQALSGMAQNLFGGKPSETPPPPPEPKSQTDQGGGFDFAQMAKLASVLGAIQGAGKKDPRCDLLFALKPLLASDKQPKVDQAVKMLRLLSIIPKIKELGG